MIEDRDAVPGEAAEGGANPSPAEDMPPTDAASPGGNDSVSEGPTPPAESVDYKDRWLRTEADLQNFRKRSARDREEAVSRAQENILLDAIGVLDDLERALAAMTPEQSAEPWAQGVVLTAQHLRDLLARWDVREIEALGRPFDPSVHEALLEIDAPEGVEPGAVAQVVLKGWRRGARALRAARVVVAKTGGKD
jgi:molecular chaperone GrpE